MSIARLLLFAIIFTIVALLLSTLTYSSTAEEVDIDAHINSRWAVKLKPGTDPEEFAKRHGIAFLGQVGTLPNTYLFALKDEHKSNRDLASKKITAVQTADEVQWYEVQLPKRRYHRPHSYEGSSEEDRDEFPTRKRVQEW